MHNTLTHTKEKKHTPFDFHTETSSGTPFSPWQPLKEKPLWSRSRGVRSGTAKRSKNSSSLINFYGWQRGHADTCPTLGCSLLHSHHSSCTPRSVYSPGVCAGKRRKERERKKLQAPSSRFDSFTLTLGKELFLCLSSITLHQSHESNIHYITTSSTRLEPDGPHQLRGDGLI